jgi:hypothetical protein
MIIMNIPRIIIGCCFLFCFPAESFSQAYDTYIDYKKLKCPAVALIANVPSDVAGAALDEDLKQHGLKGKSLNGFKVYERVVFSPFSNENINIYTTVKKDDEKSPDKCIVYIIVEKINADFVSPTDNPQIYNNVKKYLNNFNVTAKDMHYQIQISDQGKNLEKAQKKLSSLVKDSVIIVKKMTELETKAHENQTEMELQRNEIKMQQQVLDNLISGKEASR